MKLAFNSTQVMASDGMEVSKMGMDADSADIFTYYLRDKIYTQKHLAPVREYITNAIDEHVKHNIQRPVEVAINKINDSYIWSVRDYAMGLSEHDVRTIFAMYGKSTKRDSNKQTGMFGLGSKSAMAYTDTFYITSYFNGVVTSYVATLGKSSSGVPVGELYKVDENPTTEQGIEVSFDITKDYYKFVDETTRFVNNLQPDCNVVFTDITTSTSKIHQPLQPIGESIKGEYIFRKYVSDYGDHTIQIRMGGVVYDTKTIKYYTPYRIVVDIPIGKMSIPISREGLETTPQNDKILNEIYKHIDEIYEEDRSSLTIPKFGNLRSGNAIRETDIKGNWFNFNFKQSFPDTYHYYYNVGVIKSENNIQAVNDKYLIYVFPNIKNTKSWETRLENALKKIYPDYEGYMRCNKQVWESFKINNSDSLDISDCVFVDIKTLKLPKLEKGEKGEVAYQVIRSYYNKKSYTPEDLDEYVTTKIFKGVETDDKWWETVEDINVLDYRTIGLVKDTNNNNKFWRANSQKMVDAMVNLGWLTPSSPERVAKINEIIKKAQMADLKKNAVYNAKNAVWDIELNPRTINAVQLKPERVEKIKRVKDLINKENSTRKRILNSIRTYSSNLTRNDLRVILKLK